MVLNAARFVDDTLADYGILPFDPHKDSQVLWCPDDPVTWIEEEFFIPETGGAIRLEEYQKRVLREAFRRDDNGDFVYSLILWSDLKKSAKSTIAAGAVLWLAWHHGWETCRVVGNDLKQASSRTFYYIERALSLNERFKPHVKAKLYHIELDNNTVLSAIPVDPGGEAGGGDLIVCFTELWAAKNDAAQRLWTETTLSPLKYGQSVRFCESYAGYSGESPILEQLYNAGVKEGVRLDDDLELYANPAARLLVLWNTTPRCSWQSAEYYQQEAATLTPSEFQRVHRNQWVSSEDVFVPAEWWDACRGGVPPLEPYESLVVAVDAGVSSDCFAIVGVSRREDVCYVRYCRVWTPPKGGKIDFSEPEGELRRLAREYLLTEINYDPFQLEDMMMRLRKEGIAYIRPFPQGADRLEADKQLYDRIRERRIRHSGEPDLREHIVNANQKPDAEGSKLRIVKRAEHLKIDSCVALGMSCARAAYLNIG